ncbi:MAG TPA: amidohydrolase family protein [Polyangiaceae bacterium]|nr:amidohydrolase family protein [Polyangiaceae bacterium]
MRILDADGHVLEPPLVWTEYAEASFRETMIQIRRGPDGSDYIAFEGQLRGYPPKMLIAAACSPRGLAGDRSTWIRTWDKTMAGGRDPEARLRDMDTEGIDAVFLYPSLWLVVGELEDPAVAAASCRAYNNWLSDFCKGTPHRLFGVATIPLQSVEEAVKELHRTARLGFRAACIRPNPYKERRLSDPALDPFWRAAQELNMGVALHGNFTSRTMLGNERYADNPVFLHAVCHPFEQQAACMEMIMGGVLDRFPRLRVAFMESGAGWAAYWLGRLTEHYESMRSLTRELRREPLECFRDQCFITEEPEGEKLSALLEAGLESNVMWASDYPHFDVEFPRHTKLVEQFHADLPAATQRKLLVDNCKRFYCL